MKVFVLLHNLDFRLREVFHEKDGFIFSRTFVRLCFEKLIKFIFDVLVAWPISFFDTFWGDENNFVPVIFLAIWKVQIY